MNPGLQNTLSMVSGFALCGVLFYSIFCYSVLESTVIIDISNELVCTEKEHKE